MIKKGVIFSPEASKNLKLGFDQMALLMAGTLGPSQGIVLNEKDTPGPPEILTDSATIARRIIALPQRQQDMGAMILRQMVWRMKTRMGDGAATTAVLGQAILDEATKLLTAGINLIDIQAGVRQTADVAIAQLQKMARPADNWQTLAAVGMGATGHAKLGKILGEMVDVLGVEAHITTKDYMAPTLEREYIDGGRWAGKLISIAMQNAAASRQAIQHNAHIALYAEKLIDPADLVPLMKIVFNSQSKTLFLACTEFSPEVESALIQTHASLDNGIKIVAVKMLRAGETGLQELEDIATLTGAQVLGAYNGRMITGMTPADLGFARRVTANNEDFTLTQGNGDQDTINIQVAELITQMHALPKGDKNIPVIESRIARLGKKAGLLKIGAHSKTERQFLIDASKKGAQAVKLAAQGGVVPGGGTAFLHCIDAVSAETERLVGDQKSGGRVMQKALAAPFKRILTNRGIPVPEFPMEQVLAQPPGMVFDVMKGELVNGELAGLLDPAEVAIEALRSAVSGALMALSVEAIVLHKNPELSHDP